jgi:hypothetical protein
MRAFSKSVAAFVAMSMVMVPLVARAETRPAPVKLAKVAGSRLGLPQGNVQRASAVTGTRDNLALGFLPLLGILAGVVAVTVVVSEVTGDSSPN